MNGATIAALATAIPSIIAALTAMIVALRAKGSATVAQSVATHALGTINDHIIKVHDAFPIQPATETKP